MAQLLRTAVQKVVQSGARCRACTATRWGRWGAVTAVLAESGYMRPSPPLKRLHSSLYPTVHRVANSSVGDVLRRSLQRRQNGRVPKQLGIVHGARTWAMWAQRNLNNWDVIAMLLAAQFKADNHLTTSRAEPGMPSTSQGYLPCFDCVVCDARHVASTTLKRATSDHWIARDALVGHPRSCCVG